MYCINKNTIRYLTSLWHKKTKRENTILQNSKLGLGPPYLLFLTKLARKIFFATLYNDLILKNIFFKLNRYEYSSENISLRTTYYSFEKRKN